MSDGLQPISKSCVNCKVRKPLDAFGKNTRAADGLKYGCRACELLRVKAYREKHRDVYLKTQKQYRLRNLQERKQSFRDWYEKNKNAVIQRAIAWAKANPAKARDSINRWQQANPHKRVEATAAYRAQRERATPKWADRKEIQRIYELANIMTVMEGVPFHVDHYYPLRGKSVCGLHVPANLQILTSEANKEKSNRLPGGSDV